MARVAILLSVLAFLLLLVNVAVGLAASFGWLSVRSHANVAVPTNILALFAWTVVLFYFVGALAWVKEAVEEERLDSDFVVEARSIHSQILPWVIVAVLALIAAYVVGGGADTGAVPPVVHLLLALVALFLHLIAAYRTIIVVGMFLDLQLRIEKLRIGD